MMRLFSFLILTLCLAACTNNDPVSKVIESVNEDIDTYSERSNRAIEILDSLKNFSPAFSRSQEMAYNLTYSKAMNLLYIPFKSDSIMLKVDEYYSKHGNKNEKMWSKYILGCVYRDLRDAPMAIEYYNKALAYTDSSKRCLLMLARIHNQKSFTFSLIGLDSIALKESDEAAYYGMKAGDTLNSILDYNLKSASYLSANNIDKAIEVNKKASELCRKYGFYKDADIIDAQTFLFDLKKGDFKTAKQKMDKYEQLSGFFQNGEIQEGKEIYYYDKGLYYMGVNMLDSAEIMFRKCLKHSQDVSCVSSGLRGLSLMYQKAGISDSAAKYAILSYEANDSAYQRNIADKVVQMQSMYDYGRYKDIAADKTAESARMRSWLFLAVLFTLAVVALAVIMHIKNKKDTELSIKETTSLFEAAISRLKTEKEELKKLLENSNGINTDIINEKEQEVKELNEKIRLYEEKIKEQGMAVSDCIVQNSHIATRFRYLANHPKERPTNKDWKELNDYISNNMPGLYNLMVNKNIKYEERLITYLIKLNLKPGQIASVLGMKTSSLTMARKRLFKKVFDEEGTANDYDRRIMSM